MHAISAQKQAFNLVIQHDGKLTDAASRKQGTADEAIHRDPIKGYVALLQESLRFIFGHKPAGEAVFSIPAENCKHTASTPARARCWCGAAGVCGTISRVTLAATLTVFFEIIMV